MTDYTPLHLEILLHYCVSPGDYELIPENITRYSYAVDLVKAGYLFPTMEESPMFFITDRGRKRIKKILSKL